jgi:hypothetical protein
MKSYKEVAIVLLFLIPFSSLFFLHPFNVDIFVYIVYFFVVFPFLVFKLSDNKRRLFYFILFHFIYFRYYRSA